MMDWGQWYLTLLWWPSTALRNAAHICYICCLELNGIGVVSRLGQVLTYEGRVNEVTCLAKQCLYTVMLNLCLILTIQQI